MAIVPEFVPALTVLATVISRHGERFVVDAGTKTVGCEMGVARMVDQPVRPVTFGDEHMLFDAEPGCTLRVGDRVSLIPGYAPEAVNLHEAFHVVRDGIVVDVWPVLARGAGPGAWS
jgi:D-serine deaminase-like pyridoxal phosphate-dependent protein